MKLFLSTLPRNIANCFRGRMLIWHILAIVLTFILVMSGLDWRYFLATREPTLRSWMFPAVHIGGLLPIVLPLEFWPWAPLPGARRSARSDGLLPRQNLLAPL